MTLCDRAPLHLVFLAVPEGIARASVYFEIHCDRAVLGQRGIPCRLAENRERFRLSFLSERAVFPPFLLPIGNAVGQDQHLGVGIRPRYLHPHRD
jgi:hypothetical protein